MTMTLIFRNIRDHRIRTCMAVQMSHANKKHKEPKNAASACGQDSRPPHTGPTVQSWACAARVVTTPWHSRIND